jgi:hypothetical protein
MPPPLDSKEENSVTRNTRSIAMDSSTPGRSRLFPLPAPARHTSRCQGPTWVRAKTPGRDHAHVAQSRMLQIETVGSHFSRECSRPRRTAPMSVTRLDGWRCPPENSVARQTVRSSRADHSVARQTVWGSAPGNSAAPLPGAPFMPRSSVAPLAGAPCRSHASIAPLAHRWMAGRARPALRQRDWDAAIQTFRCCGAAAERRWKPADPSA